MTEIPRDAAAGSARTTLASIAVAGVIIYASVDVVLQFLPPHYSPIADAESDLAVGRFGWIMTLNFFGRGITSAALIAAILSTGPRTSRRTIGSILFGIAGACSALLAFFRTDIPIKGQPVMAATTMHGTIHVIGATAGFVFALAAIWPLTRWIRQAIPSAFRAAEVFVAIASLGAVFLTTAIIAIPEVVGLAERICLVGILGWVFTVAVGIIRQPASTAAASTAATSTTEQPRVK